MRDNLRNWAEMNLEKRKINPNFIPGDGGVGLVCMTILAVLDRLDELESKNIEGMK